MPTFTTDLLDAYTRRIRAAVTFAGARLLLEAALRGDDPPPWEAPMPVRDLDELEGPTARVSDR